MAHSTGQVKTGRSLDLLASQPSVLVSSGVSEKSCLKKKLGGKWWTKTPNIDSGCLMRVHTHVHKFTQMQLCTHMSMHTYTHMHKKKMEEPASPEMHGCALKELLDKIKHNQEGRWASGRNVGQLPRDYSITRSSHHSVAIFFFFFGPDFSAYDGNTYFCLTSR